jgi:hypothetical protein
MTEEIQRKRTKGWKSPPNTIYVGRPSIWGNPFTVIPGLYKTWYVFFEGKSTSGEFTTKLDAQAEAVRLFEKWFDDSIAEIGTELYNFREKYSWKGFQLATVAPHLLRRKFLSCWCSLDEPCHRTIILRYANRLEKES